jgi:CubicO group peptidase (beta-lactamase class C family)
MRRILVAALSVLAASGVQPSAIAAQQGVAADRPVVNEAARLQDVDSFVTAMMTEWKVPGLAIAVVRDGEVILSKGYGYRDLDERLPVTRHTLFAIGSITKSFTVTVLGALQDEEHFDWDEPVRTYLPDFGLYDDIASERMTPRDLVTHRSGLPRHDLLWYGSDFTRRELYERLRYLEPNEDFRARYQYQNLMFMTAGYLAGRLTGSRWEDLVRERVFEPLDMSRSNFSVVESQRTDDFAYPYNRVGDEVRQIDFRNIDEIGPAGSINSSVEEMIRYVQLHIEKGKYGDEELLSERNAEQMQTPQMVMPGNPQYDELGHTSYGMGFFVTTYRGQKLVRHGGGIDGFISSLSFMPRQKMGIIVLTNLSGNNPVPNAVSLSVYDRLLGLEPVDWVGRVKEREAEAREAREAAEEEGGSERAEGTSPSHDLADYAGDYEHLGYGAIRIELDGGNLFFTFHDVKSALEHFHYDVFEVPENPLVPFGGMKVMFLYKKSGEIDRLVVPFEPNVDDIVFARIPAP